MSIPNGQTTPNAVRKAKRRARNAWLAVADARTRGAKPAEIARLEAEARAASADWYAARGVTNPHQLAKARAA